MEPSESGTGAPAELVWLVRDGVGQAERQELPETDVEGRRTSSGSGGTSMIHGTVGWTDASHTLLLYNKMCVGDY